MNEQQPTNNTESNKAQQLFTFVAILVVMVGQILVYTTPVNPDALFPPSIWITVAGVALFIWSRVDQPPQRVEAFFARIQFSRTTLWVTLSLILSLLAVLTMVLFERYGRTNFIPVLTFWVFATLCYITAFLNHIPSISQLREWLKLHRYELLAIGLVTLLGFALRFYKLGEIPKVVNGDEGRLGIAALSVNAYPFANPFALWENFGALYLQAVNLPLYLFGVSPFSLRLAAAVGGTLAIPALYLLARQISGRRIALIAACLLAISHTHTHFSRTVAVAYIQGTWLIPLELYFLLSGLMKRSSWRAAVGGALLAIHYSVYLDSQIVTGLVLVYMLVSFLFLRRWFKPALRQAAVFWGGFAIVLLPELAYIQAHPDIFFNRLTENGIVQTGWLAGVMASTGQNAVQVLGARVIHAFLALIYYPSLDFYGSQVPMLSLVSAMLFLLGLAIAFLQTHSPRMLLLNGYFWAGTFSVGMFAIPPSADSYRMLIVLPAAFLLAAIGLDSAFQALGSGWAQNPKVYTTVTALTLSGLLIFNTWAYYFHFAGRCLYGTDDSPTRFASFLGNYARTINKESETYLLSDSVYAYGTHQSVNFLSDNHFMTNIPDPIDVLQVKPDETIIATPNRISELRTWADNHPGGVLHYEYDCQQTILLAYQFP
jgi:hypothetical protein